jgi:hypothetical protein
VGAGGGGQLRDPPVDLPGPGARAQEAKKVCCMPVVLMLASTSTGARMPGGQKEIRTYGGLVPSSPPWSACRPLDAPPTHGPALVNRLCLLEREPPSARFPPGTRLWIKVPGSGLWPGVAWTFRLCKRRDWGQLVLAHRPGAQRALLPCSCFGQPAQHCSPAANALAS